MDRLQGPEIAPVERKRRAPHPSLRGTFLVLAILVLLWCIQGAGKESGPVSSSELMSLLPEPPDGWQASVPRGVLRDSEGLEMKGKQPVASLAERTYWNRDILVKVQIQDRPGSPEGFASWPFRILKRFVISRKKGKDRESGKTGGWPARILYNSRTRTGRLTVSLSERFQVVIHGEEVGMPAFQAWMRRIDRGTLCAKANVDCLP